MSSEYQNPRHHRGAPETPPAQSESPTHSGGVSLWVWILASLFAVIGGAVFVIVTLRAESAVQEIAAAMMGIAISLIPFLCVRALDEALRK